MIPFSPPRIDQKILDEVAEALRSGWITTGPRTKEFERQLVEFTGAKSVLCVNSATAGMELILRWFGVGPGDEVLLPAYTYCSTANVVEHCGATPVLVDATSEFNLSLEDAASKITPRTKAIMPVDIGGWPCDYEAIMQLVEEKREQFRANNPIQAQLGRMLVLSDAAHSVGALYKGKRTGSVSDVAVFSFHAVKNLTTAEGGAIAINLPEAFDHSEIYTYLNTLSLHGQNKDARAKMQKGNWRYDVIAAGYKCNMTDIQAAIGLVELSRYASDTLPKRKAIFERYTRGFEGYDWAELPPYQSEEKTSSYHLYLLRIKGITEAQRDAIIQRIFDQDVSVNVHFQPLPILSHYKNQGYRMDDYPVAYDQYSREISLPVYYDLDPVHVETVVKAVVTAVEAEL